MDEAARRARAEARRRTAVLSRTRLQPVEADLAPLSGAEAVSLVHALTLESWSESGRELPRYTRRETPIRFVPRRGS